MSHEIESSIRAAFPEESRLLPAGGFAAVLERRLRGERVSLRPGPPPAAAWRRWLALGAAAALCLWLGIPPRPAPNAAPHPASPRMASAGVIPVELLVQGSLRPSFPAARTSGPELRPGQWSYAFIRPGHPFTDSTRVTTIRLDRSEYAGRPAWRFVGGSGQRLKPFAWSDTSWVDPVTLRYLARVSRTAGGATLTQEYRDDGILTGYSSGGVTSWTPVAIDSTSEDFSAGIPIRGEVFFPALKRAPLGAGWNGSIQLISMPVGGRAAQRWFDLEVVGEEQVTVPAGTFDCWKVRFGPGARRDPDPDAGFFFWVSRKEQWIVQEGGYRRGGELQLYSILVAGSED